MKIINQKVKSESTTIIVMTIMMSIAAITMTTTMMIDNPFTNIQKAYAQEPQPANCRTCQGTLGHDH